MSNEKVEAGIAVDPRKKKRRAAVRPETDENPRDVRIFSAKTPDGELDVVSYAEYRKLELEAEASAARAAQAEAHSPTWVEWRQRAERAEAQFDAIAERYRDSIALLEAAKDRAVEAERRLAAEIRTANDQAEIANQTHAKFREISARLVEKDQEIAKLRSRCEAFVVEGVALEERLKAATRGTEIESTRYREANRALGAAEDRYERLEFVTRYLLDDYVRRGFEVGADGDSKATVLDFAFRKKYAIYSQDGE